MDIGRWLRSMVLPSHSSSEGLQAPHTHTHTQLPLLELASIEVPGNTGSQAKMKALSYWEAKAKEQTG